MPPYESCRKTQIQLHKREIEQKRLHIRPHMQRVGLDENSPVEKSRSATNQWVPHISLVFREMWDTTDLYWRPLESRKNAYRQP
jgi:hypothetical protein